MYFILFYFIFKKCIGNMLTFVHLTIHMTHFYKCDIDKNIMLVEKNSGILTGIDLRETAYQSDAYSTWLRLRPTFSCIRYIPPTPYNIKLKMC